MVAPVDVNGAAVVVDSEFARELVPELQTGLLYTLSETARTTEDLGSSDFSLGSRSEIRLRYFPIPVLAPPAPVSFFTRARVRDSRSTGPGRSIEDTCQMLTVTFEVLSEGASHRLGLSLRHRMIIAGAVVVFGDQIGIRSSVLSAARSSVLPEARWLPWGCIR